mgnify:CR=1 FL=1
MALLAGWQVPVIGAILEKATDAAGRPLHVELLAAPEQGRELFESDEFAAGYVNFYVCNGAVVVPRFGDDTADATARDQLADLYPGRAMVQLDIDPVAEGGGGIHCATQQQPKVG